MATYSTTMCTPADEAPEVTYQVAKCTVCHVSWQVQSPNGDDTKGCSFCGAPEDAITVISEALTY